VHRFVLPSLAILIVAGASAPSASTEDRAVAASAAATFEASIKPFLATHCYLCHNARLTTAGLNLEALASAGSVAHDPDAWDAVLLKLRSGEMPPEGARQPPDEAVQAAIAWIDRELVRADQTAKPDPGRVTARRLNRAEYNNTIRDLLGVDLRPADDFPQDDAGYGFDNIADVLSLPPVLMERYLAAAERVTRTALFGVEPMKPTLTRLQAPGRRVIESEAVPESYDASGLTLPNAAHVTYRVPVDGEYVIRAVAGGVRPRGSAPIDIALWIDGRQTMVESLDPASSASFSEERQDLGGKHVEFRARLTAGDRWIAAAIPRLYEGLPTVYNGPKPSPLVLPPLEFKPPPNAPPERVERMRKGFEARMAQKTPANAARVSYIEVLGPYEHSTAPSAASLRKIYTCGHLAGGHEGWCARRIVSSFARRAFRRPVTSAEVKRFTSLMAESTKAGDSFAEALSVALQAILVSPDFLFRIERPIATAQAVALPRTSPVAAAAAVGAFRPRPSHAPAAGSSATASALATDHARSPAASRIEPIGQYALASRLSYFLWSSMPDEPLMQAAAAGTLRRPAVLAAQVRRMLRDPRSAALVENFGGQWLQFRALESVAPDRERFPAFEDYLRLSMRRETELFFASIVREDRSVLDFIDAKYTFLNERLARHYGVPGVTGPEFRRVPLAGPQRSGVITHGSVLTVSSYSTRTSPVLRGKWILENILNAPPPDPPPGVPPLDEGDPALASASVRQQLEAHRKNPTCASCHRRMDPLGFGLENYDAVGAWRSEDGKFPVDSAGTLPDGRSFDSPEELKTILKADREYFARALTSKLLTSALGRGLERPDRQTVRTIARRVGAADYRFSSLVLEIVKSPPFQMRRGDTP
jgi:cytochrome c5